MQSSPRTLTHAFFRRCSAVSALSVFLVLLFCLHEMVTNGPSPQPPTELVASGGGVLNAFHSLSSMVFACGASPKIVVANAYNDPPVYVATA